MRSKVAVITGSPRGDGNSFAMTDAFIRRAEADGHTVTRFDAALRKVGGCRACETCFKTGKACSFDDDFDAIAPAILEADVVVFSMPVYWYSIPAQIKGVIDRICSFVVGGRDIAGKRWGSSPAARRMTFPSSTGCASRWSAWRPLTGGNRSARCSSPAS